MSLGSRVRDLRKQLRLSQEDLADKIDVDRSYISHIENSRTQQPSKDVIRSLARALETTTEDLFGALLGHSGPVALPQEHNEHNLFYVDLSHVAENVRRRTRRQIEAIVREAEVEDAGGF